MRQPQRINLQQSWCWKPPDKEWLEYQYLTLDKTQREIATKVGCSHGLVGNWCKLHGLTKRLGPRSEMRKGSNNLNWKGGKRVRKGRVYLRLPDHPSATAHGSVRRSHTIWEENTGHTVQLSEVIYHKNNDSMNDDFDNLQLFPNQSEHAKYHQDQLKRRTENGTQEQ